MIVPAASMVYIVPAVLALAGAAFWFSYARDRRPTFPELPGQAAAIDHIWHTMWKIPRYRWYDPRTLGNRPPAVQWVTQLDVEGKAWTATWAGGSMAVSGVAEGNGLSVTCAWFPGQTMAKSALPHELYHQALRVRTGHQDHAHKNPAFTSPGEVRDAHEYLAAQGL